MVHRTIKFAALAAPLAVTALIASATTANAYTMDAAGNGFVGKGEVQSAFGWNNATMQKNQTGVTFTGAQPTSQSLSQPVQQVGVEHNFQMGVQSATQTGTQSGTQVVTQELTCEFTNGNGTKVFTRDGERDATRTGTREGTREAKRDVARVGERVGVRTGEQAGKQTGSVVSALGAADKKTGQYTGWYLKGFKSLSDNVLVGSPVWDAPSFTTGYTFGERTYGGWDYSFNDFAFGDYSFGDYTFGATTTWGEWDAAPGEDPSDCLRSQNADHITQISNVITPGAITNGTINDGDVVVGDTVPGISLGEYVVDGAITPVDPIKKGAVTNDGALKVFAVFGGVSKALTPAL